MPQSYPGKYGKTPTAIPSTPMAAAVYKTKEPTNGIANKKTKTLIPSSPLAAAFFTTKEPTIGMANTKKEKPSCPNGLRGNATAPT